MKTSPLSARISPEAKEKFDKICQQECRSQGTQIEYWISQFDIKENKGEPIDKKTLEELRLDILKFRDKCYYIMNDLYESGGKEASEMLDEALKPINETLKMLGK